MFADPAIEDDCSPLLLRCLSIEMSQAGVLALSVFLSGVSLGLRESSHVVATVVLMSTLK